MEPSDARARELMPLVAADLRALKIPVNSDRFNVSFLKHLQFALICYPGFACVFCYRLNLIIYRHSPRLAKLFRAWRYYRFANDISHQADIGPGLQLIHTSDIVIGHNVRIGRNCTIYNGVTLGAKNLNRLQERPTVGDNVVIGTRAKVLRTSGRWFRPNRVPFLLYVLVDRLVRIASACCRSSVVEHSLGKGEVESSIPSGSTIGPTVGLFMFRAADRSQPSPRHAARGEMGAWSGTPLA